MSHVLLSNISINPLSMISKLITLLLMLPHPLFCPTLRLHPLIPVFPLSVRQVQRRARILPTLKAEMNRQSNSDPILVQALPVVTILLEHTLVIVSSNQTAVFRRTTMRLWVSLGQILALAHHRGSRQAWVVVESGE